MACHEPSSMKLRVLLPFFARLSTRTRSSAKKPCSRSPHPVSGRFSGSFGAIVESPTRYTVMGSERAEAASRTSSGRTRRLMPRSRRRHERELDEARLVRSMVDALNGFPVIPRLRPEDVRHERLWIAVVEREPGRLHLHHDPVTRKEDVVRRGKSEAVRQRFVCLL